MTLETIEIRSPDGRASASFAPGAGMVCCSLTHEGEQLLDLGRGLDAYAERGKTMGIPLLYPWANRLAEFGYSAAGKSVVLPEDPHQLPHDKNGLPIHGLIPGHMRWEATPTAAAVSAQLDWSSDALLALYPYRHTAQLHAGITEDSLTITVMITASGQDSVPISFGFHPYLRLPTANRVEAQVELPACERLLLDERSIPTGARESLGPATFRLGETTWDDGLSVGGMRARFSVRDLAGTRGLDLTLLEGYDYGQIYAPPRRDYICFEPMTATANGLRSGEGVRILRPGEQHRAAFRISRVPS